MSDHLAKERKETDALRSEAMQLGIQIPRTEGWWWFDDEAVVGISPEMLRLIGTDDYEYLTELGKAGTKRLIREERNKLKEEVRKDIQWERQNTQWKLTVAGVIIGWILGLSGIVIAVISLVLKLTTH